MNLKKIHKFQRSLKILPTLLPKLNFLLTNSRFNSDGIRMSQSSPDPIN